MHIIDLNEEGSLSQCGGVGGLQAETTTYSLSWRNVLIRSCTTKGMYRQNRLVEYKRPKNLKDYLVRAKIDYHPNEAKTESEHTNMCRKKDCLYCKLLDKTGIVEHKGRKEESKHNITCNSSNVIYCIECTKCNHRYVGQTKRKIKDRLREHLYGIKSQKETDRYHFNTNGHKG